MAVPARLLAVAVLLLVCIVVGTRSAAMVHRRSVGAAAVTPDPGPRICHRSTPCEWAVYIPFTRRVDYIMKNTCQCAQGLVCVRTGDDLSASAYVHRCRTPGQPVDPS